MSMNFSREQSLLRQRLQAAGSPTLAAARQSEIGGTTTFLGADGDAIRAAAGDLAATYPQMGRAQMTAFVRTLWQSRIHELRAVGVELLAARAALLEAADFDFLEQLLKESETDGLAERVAGDVLGPLVSKNKKLWKDLRRFAAASTVAMQRAAVRACRRPLLDDSEAFPRFLELSEPLFAVADDALQQAIDELLTAAAAVHNDAVRELAERHGRKIKLPKRKAAAAAKGPIPAKAPIPSAKAPMPVKTGPVKNGLPKAPAAAKKAAAKRSTAPKD